MIGEHLERTQEKSCIEKNTLSNSTHDNNIEHVLKQYTANLICCYTSVIKKLELTDNTPKLKLLNQDTDV